LDRSPSIIKNHTEPSCEQLYKLEAYISSACLLQLWQKNGLDLGLNAYSCMATGDEMGMLQVVLNAETTSAISKVRILRHFSALEQNEHVTLLGRSMLQFAVGLFF
jgi:hypothetical protein